MISPITPPDELRRLWAQQAQRIDSRDPVAWMQHVSTQAAQWGADQELEACCEWVAVWISAPEASQLRAARRPKSPSLKESALNALEHILRHSLTDHGANTIRRALEALPND